MEITVSKPEEWRGRYFVPDYFVSWKKSGKSVAFVEFLDPTESVRQLYVKDAKYLLGKRVRVPNLAGLLTQTNATTSTNAAGAREPQR